MNNKIEALAEESINLELNVSKMYSLFDELFPDDSEFWQELVFEEESHANIIGDGIAIFEQIHAFPHELLSHNLQKLKDTNKNLEFLLAKFKRVHPSRSEAFNTALDIEISAGELHYQHFLEEKHLSSLDETFRQLNEEDKDHAIRLRAYMQENDIQ